MTEKIYKEFSFALAFLVMVLGLVSAATVMTGDSLGRVNLLYLLLLFVIFPVLSISLMIVFKMTNKDTNLMRFIIDFPFISSFYRDKLSLIKSMPGSAQWLFYQSQKMALIFSCSCLFTFVIMLLFNDITFVWRSTLLSAEQLFPILKWLALPWYVVDSAQPALAMLQSSQDFRITADNDYEVVKNWWLYVLMSQLTYSIVPRLTLYIWAKIQFKKTVQYLQQQKIKEQQQLAGFNIAQQHSELKVPLSEMVDSISSYDHFILLYWIALPEALELKVKRVIGMPDQEYLLTSLDAISDEEKLLKDSRDKVLIVPAWEPPLGELADFMMNSKGVIIAVDWQGDSFVESTSLHLDEWRRFCYELPNWQLVSSKELL
jgi:hypothetical protein